MTVTELGKGVCEVTFTDPGKRQDWLCSDQMGLSGSRRLQVKGNPPTCHRRNRKFGSLDGPNYSRKEQKTRFCCFKAAFKQTL